MDAHTILLDAGNTLLGLDHVAIAGLCARHDVVTSAEDVERADGRIRPGIDAMLSSSGRSTESRDTRLVLIGLFLDALGLAKDRRPPSLVTDLARELPKLFCRPLPGAHETLEALHDRGYRLGVVSNSDGTVERALAAAGLAAHLEVVVDSALVGVEKPDPEIFRIALSRLGVRASGAVYVGDIPSVDLVGAHAAGLEPILVDPFDNFPEPGAPRIRALPELLDLLSGRPADDSRHPGAIPG